MREDWGGETREWWEMAKMNLKVSAPGKIILSGEHAVVYGYPALVAAVNKRLSITSIDGTREIESDWLQSFL